MASRTRPFSLAPALACSLLISVEVFSASALASDPQSTANYVLTSMTPDGAARIRGNCASGDMPALLDRNRKAGLTDVPDVAVYCVAALTRLGRDGTLGFLRDSQSAQAKPALSFDTGFVTAFRRRDPVTPDLPDLAALKPVAERCLSQSEADRAVCTAAGQIIGARVAQGELFATR